jgi:putative ABC transport system ATP-binding protein
MDLLTRLNEEGTTIVMVTHSLPHAEYAKRIINMLDGQVLNETIFEQAHSVAT